MMLWAVALALQVRVVTLDEAERLAATHQPKIHEAAADTEAARARVDQAWATLLPQLRIYGSYSRTSANYAATPGSLPSSLKGRDNTFSSDTFNYFSFGIGAAQSLFDLGAIERTLLAKAATQAQMDAQRDTALQVDSLVAMSFFNVQAREALVRVARETLENRRRHRREIEGFVAARARPIIDLAQVRADEASAEVLVLQADNDCRLAKAQLGLAVGVDLGTDFVVAEESMDPVPGEAAPLTDQLDEAWGKRPDLAAARSRIEAQRIGVRAQRAGYAPTLAMSASASEAGPELAGLAWNVGVGLALNWTLFDGLRTAALVREAQAQVRSLSARREGLTQQARFEVEQARLLVSTALATQGASDVAVVNARERLRLAEMRYRAGLSSAMELADSQLALTAAAAQRVQAQFNLANARTLLLKALGRPVGGLRR